MQMCMITYAVPHLKIINMQVFIFLKWVHGASNKYSRQCPCFLQISELNVTAVVNHRFLWVRCWAHGWTSLLTQHLGPLNWPIQKISCRKFRDPVLRPCILIWGHYILVNFSETSHATVLSLDVLYRAHSGLYRDTTWLDVSPWPLPLLGLQKCLKLI